MRSSYTGSAYNFCYVIACAVDVRRLDVDPRTEYINGLPILVPDYRLSPRLLLAIQTLDYLHKHRLKNTLELSRRFLALSNIPPRFQPLRGSQLYNYSQPYLLHWIFCHLPFAPGKYYTPSEDIPRPRTHQETGS